MSKLPDLNNIWFIDLSDQPSLLKKLQKIFKSNNINLEPWDKTINTPLGILLINGSESYDQLISILNIQLKHLNNRIVVLNTSSNRISNESIFKILNYGAEYLFELSMIDVSLECIIEKFVRWRNVEIMLNAPTVSKAIIGNSPVIKKLLRGIIEVAAYSDVSVLIQGERGTGKELIANLIHELDKKRKSSNLVLVDCTTIRTELSGSEFFGHEKGSYTGAENTREGAFSLANNGTLFLDEIGETPLPMQAELLRIIQEGVYKKLGSNIWKQTNFRLVCATNRDLVKESDNGLFRKDLYDRISMWKCYMPSLNERKEDIPLLAEFFFKKRFDGNMPIIDDNVLFYLKERDYVGNIRELQNLVYAISLKYVGKGPITLGDIPENERRYYCHMEESWHESKTFTDKITEALYKGYDAKSIMDTVKSLVTKIALASGDNNKEVCQLLGKSERWIQLQKAKER